MKPLAFAVTSTIAALLTLLLFVAGVVAFFVGLWFLWGAFGFWGFVFGIPALALLIVFVESYVVARMQLMSDRAAAGSAGSRGSSRRGHSSTARKLSRVARGRGVAGRSSRSFRS